MASATPEKIKELAGILRKLLDDARLEHIASCSLSPCPAQQRWDDAPEVLNELERLASDRERAVDALIMTQSHLGAIVDEVEQTIGKMKQI